MRERTRTALLIGLLVVMLVLAFTAPIPTPAELRAMAVAAGPVAPLAFFWVYAIGASLPVPRTVFSVAAGLLLGNALGLAVALAATMTAAALGYGLARSLGGDLLTKNLHRESVRTVYERITDGGTLAVASLRLIPIVPFAPLSYCCGLSAFRFRSYLLGTLLGSLPGTATVVILGDALTGGTPPVLIACYATFAAIGTLGIYRLVRTPTRVVTSATPAPVVAGDIGHGA